MYSPKLLEHFEHPRWAGDLPEANVRVRIENPACGDILELAAVVEGGTVQAVRFKAKGCVPAMACGSAVAALAVGQEVAQLVKISRQDLLREVGEVPSASQHAIHLALDALGQLWKAAQRPPTSTGSSSTL